MKKPITRTLRRMANELKEVPNVNHYRRLKRLLIKDGIKAVEVYSKKFKA